MILIENANQSSKQKDKSKIKAATSFYRVYFDVDQKKMLYAILITSLLQRQKSPFLYVNISVP